MKGIILAGGSGTRLQPITRYINKHLLPVGPYPMIYWLIVKLKIAGIKDILIVTNKNDLASFITLLGEGEELGVNISYTLQKDARGIADGLLLGEKFAGSEKMVVLLGDNIFEDDLRSYIKAFKEQKSGARVLLKEVNDPYRYGVATINKEKQIIETIIEKPINPASNLCVTGIYLYDSQVFDFIKSITPSKRGELEITDVNNLYIAESCLKYEVLKGWWIDAGTHESLFKANTLINEQLQGQKCKEGAE